MCPCTLVPQVFGRVHYSGSCLYSSFLEGVVERWRDVLYFKLCIPCREVNLASRHCLQLFSLYFSCCTFLFLCLFVLHLVIFYAFDFCISNTNTQSNKHTFKKIIYSQLCVQIPFVLSNFLLCEILMLSRNPASLHKHVEWNILVLLQSILC